MSSSASSTVQSPPVQSPTVQSSAVQSPAWTVVAHLLRPQGRKGELLAELFTDFPERFTLHPRAFLAAPNFTGPASEVRAVEVVAHWLPQGKNLGRIVLALAGVESISAAEALAGLDVLIPTEERLPLEPGAAWIDHLIGCTVFNSPPGASEEEVGIIVSIEFSTGPDGLRRLPDVAPLLTLVTRGGNEVLIPFAEAFLLSLDLPNRLIHMRLPEGLIDLNRQP